MADILVDSGNYQHVSLHAQQTHYTSNISKTKENEINRYKTKHIDKERLDTQRRNRKIQWNKQYTTINDINKYKIMTIKYHILAEKYLPFSDAFDSNFAQDGQLRIPSLVIDLDGFPNLFNHPLFDKYRNDEISSLTIYKYDFLDIHYKKLYPSIYSGIFFGESEEMEIRQGKYDTFYCDFRLRPHERSNKITNIKQWLRLQKNLHNFTIDEYNIMLDYFSAITCNYKRINDINYQSINDVPKLIPSMIINKGNKLINYDNMSQTDIYFNGEKRTIIKINNNDNKISISGHNNGLHDYNPEFIYKYKCRYVDNDKKIISEFKNIHGEHKWWHKHMDSNDNISKIIIDSCDRTIISDDDIIMHNGLSMKDKVIKFLFSSELQLFYQKLNVTTEDYKKIYFKPNFNRIWHLKDIEVINAYIEYHNCIHRLKIGMHTTEPNIKIIYPNKKLYIDITRQGVKVQTHTLKDDKFILDQLTIYDDPNLKDKPMSINRKMFTPKKVCHFISLAFNELMSKKISYPIPKKVYGFDKCINDIKRHGFHGIRCRGFKFNLHYKDHQMVVKIQGYQIIEKFYVNGLLHKRIIHTKDGVYTEIRGGLNQFFNELQIYKDGQLTIYSPHTHLSKKLIEEKIKTIADRLRVEYDFSANLLSCGWSIYHLDKEPDEFILRYNDRWHVVKFSENCIHEEITYLNSDDSDHIIYTEKYTRIEKKCNKVTQEIKIIDKYGIRIITNDDENIKMQTMANILAKPFEYTFKKPIKVDFNKEIVNYDETQIEMILYYDNKVKEVKFYREAMEIIVKTDDIEKYIIHYGNTPGKMSEKKTIDKTKGTTQIEYQRINDENYPDIDIKINNDNELALKTKYREFTKDGKYGYKAVNSIDNLPAICKLFIPKEARVASDAQPPEMLKMRTNKAIVVGIWEFTTNNNKDQIKYLDQIDMGISCIYNNDFKYPVGSGIFVSNFDRSLDKACVPGIHFVATQEEAFAFHNLYNIKESQIHGYKNVEMYAIDKIEITEDILVFADNTGELTIIDENTLIEADSMSEIELSTITAAREKLFDTDGDEEDEKKDDIEKDKEKIKDNNKGKSKTKDHGKDKGKGKIRNDGHGKGLGKLGVIKTDNFEFDD